MLFHHSAMMIAIGARVCVWKSEGDAAHRNRKNVKNRMNSREMFVKRKIVANN